MPFLKLIGNHEIVTWIGLEFESLPSGRGVRVTYVAPDSPADQAGLEIDDVILKCNEDIINNATQLSSIIYSSAVGSRINLQINRAYSMQIFTCSIVIEEILDISEDDIIWWFPDSDEIYTYPW